MSAHPDLPVGGDEPAPTESPSLAFTVLRPRDLVHLRVSAYACTLVTDADGPAIVPDGDTARLEIGFTFQHLGEQAFHEVEGEPAEPVSPPPVRSRAALPSRLVYALPAGERISYSVEGVLAAMSRLPLLVAPLALPRPDIGRPPIGDWWLDLPGDLVLTRTPTGFALAHAPAAVVRARGREPAVDRLLHDAHSLRTARRLLSTAPARNVAAIAAPPPQPVAEGDRAVARPFLGELVVAPPIRVRPRRQSPRAPRLAETAIEAPYRLVLSPSVLGGFAHALTPVTAAGDPTRVELWHTRLGVRSERDDGTVEIDERPDFNPQRAVRAIWARDMATPPEPAPADDPFRMSLNAADRWALVRQSADPTHVPPEPVEARRLHLSALGAWLDVQGQWATTPYAEAHFVNIIESWTHLAPMGRDQFVRVVYPGYLFPFGHRAVLVKLTYRKVYTDSTSNGPQAYLFQRFYVIVREPVRAYTDHLMPLREVRVRPLVTPDLDDPNRMPRTPLNPSGQHLFWPSQHEQKYVFGVTGLDWDGRPVTLRAPLLFVGEGMVNEIGAAAISAEYENDDDIAANGQQVAYARAGKPADTTLESHNLRFSATAEVSTAQPQLADARIVVPAMQHIAPEAPQTTVGFAADYVDAEFGGGNAAGQVFLKVLDASPPAAVFGSASDRAGGFISPDLPVRGLSRVQGAVGEVDKLAGGTFDATDFLAGVTPKLFGLFTLTEVLSALGVGLEDAPAFVTESLDKVSALVADLQGLATTLQSAADRMVEDAANAVNSAVQAQLEAARDRLTDLRDQVVPKVDDLVTALTALLALDAPADLPTVTGEVEQTLTDLADLVSQVDVALAEQQLPPAVRALLERVTTAVGPLLAAAEIVTTIESIVAFVNGFDPTGVSVRARLEWRPRLANWPAGASDDDAVFVVAEDGLLLAVEVRASGAAGASVDVLAELRHFALNLLPGVPLMRLPFDRLAFRARSGRKPEVDVVFTGIEFLGVLGFIDTLRELIPFDGFADPPYVDVSTEGVTAGFDLALPNVAIGVFSLENISLGADARVPFLGEAVTVGFNFCSKDRPFRLTVMMIGGGGFVAVRLSPKGLVVLEMSLEAGASLSVNLGVASGSVSVMVGLYLRLEDDAGSLTGYFRIRGEVDVLGLISASITLELSLTYDFATGKMVGRASITVEVEVFCFSASVEISVEKQLAGSKGDPTLAQVMPPEPDGSSPHWSDYCAAFAPAGA